MTKNIAGSQPHVCLYVSMFDKFVFTYLNCDGRHATYLTTTLVFVTQRPFGNRMWEMNWRRQLKEQIEKLFPNK